MNYALLMLSVCLGSFKSVLSKASKNAERSSSDGMFNNSIVFAAALLLIFLLSAASLKTVFRGVPVYLSVLYGIATFASQFFLIQATGSGPVSLSTLFYSCNFLIPTVFGTAYYREPLHVLYFIGVALILTSFILIAGTGKDGKIGLKWTAYSLGGMCAAGIVGVIQKIFINEYAASALNGFLIIAFAVITAASLLLFAALRRIAACRQPESPAAVEACRQPESPESGRNRIKKFFLQPLLGLDIGGQNILNIYIVGVFPSAVSFPVMNGGVILMTAVISAVAFREKLTGRQTIAVAIGIAAIVCIGIGKLLIG